MDWKHLLAYVTGSIDEELLLRNEYLATENRILRGQLKSRLRLTDGNRRSLAQFLEIIEAAGVEALKLPARSPNLNANRRTPGTLGQG